MKVLYVAESTVDSTSQGELIENAGKQVNALARYWQSINWEQIISLLISKSISFLLLLIFFFIIRKVGSKLIIHSFEKYEKKENFNESRLKTLLTLTMNAFNYILFFFFLYSFLTLVGIPVGSLLAGAGIAGVAIGLGAQGFINDIITGFFIILEKQIEVGDYVKIDTIEGTVLSIGLRTTKINAADGTVHFIPNHCISIISNLSRGNMRVLIDIRIQPGEDIQVITQCIEKVNQELLPDFPEIQSGPDLLGITDLGNGSYVFRVIMYTLNGAQYKVQRQFLSAYVEALTQAGIKIPVSPLQLTN